MTDDDGSKLFLELSVEETILKDEAAGKARTPTAKVSWVGSGGVVMPARRPKAPRARPQVEGGRCDFKGFTAGFTIKRSKGTCRKAERNSVDLVLKRETRGGFLGLSTLEETLAKAEVPLERLLQQCSFEAVVGMTLPLNRKPRRGQVRCELRLHHPLGDDGHGRELVAQPVAQVTSRDPGPEPESPGP